MKTTAQLDLIAHADDPQPAAGFTAWRKRRSSPRSADNGPVIADIDELEQMAVRLESAGMCKVLRRLTAPPPLPADGVPIRRAVFVDVETTGLDSERDEVIELAMAAFDYTIDGRVLGQP